MLLMSLLMVIGLSIVNSNFSRIDSLLLEKKEKIALIAKMRRASRERTVSLQKMLMLDDPFARDEEAQVLRSYGAQFIAARDGLRQLPLTADEERRFQAILERVSVNAPFQLELLDKILSGRTDGVWRTLHEIAIPRQEIISEMLSSFINYQGQVATDAVAATRGAYTRALYLMSLLAGLVILLAATIAVFVTRHIAVAEQRLQNERERAQITLHSIGDAVITVDHLGRIEQMNTVAEQLTGFTLKQIRGRPSDEVLELAHEAPGLPMLAPLAGALSRGEVARSDGDALLVHPNNSRLAIQYTAAPIHDPNGTVTGAILVFRDVTDMRKLTHQLEHQARHDELTGLFNRREMEACLERELAEVRRYPDKISWLCFMDMDQFKLINDTCGHAAGDELLKQIASILALRLRAVDLVSRIGGDEFAWLISDCSRETAVGIVESIRYAIELQHFSWEDKTYSPTASIGMTPVTPCGGNPIDLLSAADAACYVSKESGRNRLHVYEQNDVYIERRTGEMEMVHKLNGALERDGFTLYGQLIKPLADGTCRLHIEILLRMLGEAGAPVLPGAFIPAAERYNLMPRIDRWVVSNTLRQFSAAVGPDFHHSCCICINLSAQSICEDGFLPFVLAELKHSSLPPADVCFEITETAAIANLSKAMKFIGAVTRTGCQFALDDFGSGLSSFAYLKNLPVNFLKMDGCFVRDMMVNPIDQAMVESISQIGRLMGMETIAECVEDPAVIDLLRQVGVDYAQGYAVGHPVPIAGLLQEGSFGLTA
ncbi:MAG: EAL domain-containing protein [Thiogranum sp.]|nr:EAL domain-containing protein [Thiogranum sp.]